MGTPKLRTHAGMAAAMTMVMSLAGCASTCTPDGRGAPPPEARQPGPPPPMDPQHAAAFQACAQAQGLTLPGNGGPGPAPGSAPLLDHEKLEACLQAAGIAPPPPPPGPPLQRPDPAFDTAFQACAGEQGVSLPERGPGQRPQRPPGASPGATDGKRIDRAKMDLCLRGKGIEPPAGLPPPG